jgi:hypothetical protein
MTFAATRNETVLPDTTKVRMMQIFLIYYQTHMREFRTARIFFCGETCHLAPLSHRDRKGVEKHQLTSSFETSLNPLAGGGGGRGWQENRREGRGVGGEENSFASLSCRCN